MGVPQWGEGTAEKGGLSATHGWESVLAWVWAERPPGAGGFSPLFQHGPQLVRAPPSFFLFPPPPPPPVLVSACVLVYLLT
eukprot:COSAG02_NODE_37727_length_438_cov_0.867257_1_plen_80_part_10